MCILPAGCAAWSDCACILRGPAGGCHVPPTKVDSGRRWQWLVAHSKMQVMALTHMAAPGVVQSW